MSCSVTSPWSYTIEFSQAIEALASGFLGELLQEPDALAGPGTEDVGADAADCHQLADAVGLMDREIDSDAAAHRIADDVNTIHPERVEEGCHRALSGDHRMASEVVTDSEPRELEDEASELPCERGQHTAEVAPAGDTRARAVQKEQRWPVADVVVAQRPCWSADFAEVVLGRAGGLR